MSVGEGRDLLRRPVLYPTERRAREVAKCLVYQRLRRPFLLDARLLCGRLIGCFVPRCAMNSRRVALFHALVQAAARDVQVRARLCDRRVAEHLLAHDEAASRTRANGSRPRDADRESEDRSSSRSCVIPASASRLSSSTPACGRALSGRPCPRHASPSSGGGRTRQTRTRQPDRFDPSDRSSPFRQGGQAGRHRQWKGDFIAKYVTREPDCLRRTRPRSQNSGRRRTRYRMGRRRTIGASLRGGHAHGRGRSPT
jgi:hypothetical protein